jgi:AraC-like DNA-binding protein
MYAPSSSVFSVPPAQVVRRESTGDDRKTAELVAELLRAGLDTLDANREAATQYIAKAWSVLETSGIAPSARAPDNRAIRGTLVAWQVKRVKAHIESRLDQTMTAAELSATVHLSPGYFQRAFKKSFGISPHAFVLRRRIERAQEMMLATNDPLCQIALSAGFSDQAHFTRRFRRAIGMSPAAWRRETKVPPRRP